MSGNGNGKGDTQDTLFDLREEWEKEWVGMPEFSQENLHPEHSIIVHFQTQIDFLNFCKVMDMEIKPSDKSIWFPGQAVGSYADKRYEDG